MNKCRYVILSLFLLGFCKSLFAIGHLEFFLDKDRIVLRCEAYDGMKFHGDPATYIGKDVLEIVPLSAQDKLELMRSFSLAAHAKEMVKTPYKLEGKTYLAEIRPQQNHELSFFVKVYEALSHD